MLRIASVMGLVLLSAGSALRAEESVRIDPVKAAQLRRLEPLTVDKVEVFVDAGQLTRAQADLIEKNISGGKLALPESALGAEPARRVRIEPPVPVAPRNPYAGSNDKHSPEDRDHLARLVRDYRNGSRPEIGRELRTFRPAVNAVIAESYPDPIDLPIKVHLWEEVAGPANRDAAIGLFESHRAAYELAGPVLIPYAKDVGGAMVRRKSSLPDAGQYPTQRWMDSRSLRDMILEIEGLIARCPGPNAAIFLMGVYSRRYDIGEAPMRDKGRDRHRLVEACGGNPKKFDEDEPDTWHSDLNAAERTAIAERLIPWLHRDNSDRRKVARNGLMICLNCSHPEWDAGREEWERWWKEHKDELAAAH